MTQTLRAARVIFAPRSATAQALAGDIEEMHRFTMRCLADVEGGAARVDGNLLWRTDTVDRKPALVIQSTHEKANFDGLRFVPGVERVDVASDVLGRLSSRLTSGSHLRFMLRANPTASVRKRRVPITDHAALIEWLTRRGQGAFALAQEEFFGTEGRPLAVSVEREGSVSIPDRGIRLSSVSYAGILTVQDEVAMRRLLVEGVGRGKAFGFGLLQVV